MQKRLVASVLWFAAILASYELVWSLTDAPRAFGPILAVAAATFVGLDPFGRVWARANPSTAPNEGGFALRSTGISISKG